MTTTTTTTKTVYRLQVIGKTGMCSYGEWAATRELAMSARGSLKRVLDSDRLGMYEAKLMGSTWMDSAGRIHQHMSEHVLIDSEQQPGDWDKPLPTSPVDRLVTHHSLPITAPESVWRACGWNVYVDGKLGDHRSRHCHAPENSVFECLALACGDATNDGPAIIRAAITEHRRRQEQIDNRRTMQVEAAAIAKLADAITSATEASVLDRLLSRLSEATRHAIRRQLGV